MKMHTSRLAALLAGAASLATINSIHLPAVQADPPDHAPAWGRRAKDDGPNGRGNGHGADKEKKDKAGRFDRGGHQDGDYDDDDREGDDRDYGGYNQHRTRLTGVVERDLSGNRFELRSSGRLYEVRADNEPGRLSRGDRVQVQGFFDGDIFRADSVRLLDNNGNDGFDGRTGHVSVNATVLEVLSSTELRVRGDNGQNYRVRSRVALSPAVSRNDRVRINGTASGGLVTVERVVLLRNGVNPGVNPGSGQTVNFAGRVERVVLQRNVLLVRGDNGITYSVRSPNADDFHANDRIRVIGTYANGVVVATRLVRL